MKYAYLLLISILIINCSESTQPSRNNHVGLPNEFPLEVGNAWVYERYYYDNQVDTVYLDTMFLDTLYIYDMYNDFYKYSWRPGIYTSLVKNVDDKLLIFGRIFNVNHSIDTSYFDKPAIWLFFNIDTGFIDTSKYSNYWIYGDSFHVSIQYSKEYFGIKYDTYVQKYFDDYYNETRHQYVNSLGFVHWMNYDVETGNLNSETKMIKTLKNFYPPIDTSLKNISLNNQIYNNGLYTFPDGKIFIN